MSEDNVQADRVLNAMRAGADSVKKKAAKVEEDIFSTIQPDTAFNSSGMKVTDVYESEELLKSDDPQDGFKRPPLVIKDDPNYRQYLKIKKKRTEKDDLLINYLEKYVGRILYYYKSNFDLMNGVTSDIVIQSNFVPFSPMRRYVIPSGIPVAIPRWIILFLREQCINNIISFEKKPEHILKSEMEMAKSSNFPFVDDATLVMKKGDALIKITDLPCMPKSLAWS